MAQFLNIDAAKFNEKIFIGKFIKEAIKMSWDKIWSLISVLFGNAHKKDAQRV